MSVDRTQLEWTYRPTDFFEAVYRYRTSEYELTIDAGKALAVLTRPEDPIPSGLLARLTADVENVFLLRQLHVLRKYDLEGPRVHQQAADRKSVAISLDAAATIVTAVHADIIARDAAGNVVRDTKAERITEDTQLLDSVLPNLDRSPTLRALLTSYRAAVNDPANELVHLYEIRDALAQHYGGKEPARKHLSINEAQWQRLGSLANIEPLEQGRHRGRHHAGRRHATATELEEARRIVRGWILAFARTL